MNAVQCKMARAAVGIGVRELAAAAKVSPDTVARLERGEQLRERTVDAIRAALEAAGVEFTNGDQPGVRLRAQQFDVYGNVKDPVERVVVQKDAGLPPHCDAAEWKLLGSATAASDIQREVRLIGFVRMASPGIEFNKDAVLGTSPWSRSAQK